MQNSSFPCLYNQPLFLGILNRNNAKHMYALHYIFLPRINHAIDSFKTGWNNHPLQTERNWSPKRLWINGTIEMRNSQVPHIGELQENMLRGDEIHWYGIDWNGPIPHNDEISGWVELEDLDSPLNDIEEEYRCFI